MPLTKAPIKQIMKNPQPEIKMLDELAEWCAMPYRELQNQIAWCFQTFADFTGYGNQDQYFGQLIDKEYIRYNAVAIPVRSCQCHKQDIQMVRCIGFTRWRTHMTPRNDVLLLWSGTSPDGNFESTAGYIPTPSKCLLIVVNGEHTIKGLFVLVQRFATGLIRHTAGMVIVAERHQRPMQPLYHGSYRGKPLFSVRTSYIAPISLHLLPLMPQQDILRWYMSNKIDLAEFNLYHM